MNTRSGPQSEGVARGHRPRIRLQLLDSFEVTRDRDVVRLPMSSRRVVAYLALRGHPVLRVHVAGSLWLDSPEE